MHPGDGATVTGEEDRESAGGSGSNWLFPVGSADLSPGEWAAVVYVDGQPAKAITFTVTE